MTKDELLKAIEENTQGPRWWEGITTAVDAYSSALLQQTQCKANVCQHPRAERSYIGEGMLRCNICGAEFK